MFLVMGDWYNKIETRVTEQLKGARHKDLRFFRVEEYFRMTRRVEGFASSCRECNTFKYEIEKTSELVGQAVASPGKARITYDRLIGKLSKHMQKQHGFYPPFYFTYLLSVTYALVASVFGFVASLLFTQADKWFFIITAFIIGLIAGNLKGAKKDSVVRNNKKLL